MVPQLSWCRSCSTCRTTLPVLSSRQINEVMPDYCCDTSLAARRKSIAFQNRITDLQGAIDFDAIVPVVNYNHETIDRIFSSSSSALQLTVPRVKTDFARRACRVAAPQIWNHLPVNLQSSQSVHVFKSRLKTFLFNCASELTNVD